LIRQAISCDICSAEKKHLNHWFISHESGGELRISGLNSRTRLRPGSKHLCGHTCLHKLVDEFMARTISLSIQTGAEVHSADLHTGLRDAGMHDEFDAEPELPAPRRAEVQRRVEDLRRSEEPRPRPADLGLKSGLDLPAPIDSNRTDQARAGSENTSGRLMPSPEPVTPIRPTLRPAPGVVSMPGRPQTESSATPDEAARFSSRSWRSEAWDRERERELKALENPKAARRRAGS
jgi:hypothetical protein